MSDLDNSGSDCAATDILVLGGIVVTMDERRTILADARALKLDQLVGSLEPGKRADVVIIDLDEDNLVPLYDPMSHLAYAVEAADVRRVVIDGRVVLGTACSPRPTSGRFDAKCAPSPSGSAPSVEAQAPEGWAERASPGSCAPGQTRAHIRVAIAFLYE